MTDQSTHNTRVELEFQGKQGWIVLDQIRTVDKSRLTQKLGRIEADKITQVKAILREMLVD